MNSAPASLLAALPFAGLLLSIALVPLLAARFWHHHYGKVAAFWALAWLLPGALAFGVAPVSHGFLDAMLLEYLPFIILIGTLYVIAGDIRLTGQLSGTPWGNTLLLGAGTLLASVMGTTGASVLLVRPLLHANAHRKSRAHQVVFFIFLVSNIGGALTPLGDPPLFLGFLKGVEFFWTGEHLWPMMLSVAGVLLGLFFIMDWVLWQREGAPRSVLVHCSASARQSGAASKRLGVEGGANVVLLLMAVALVLGSGLLHKRAPFYDAAEEDAVASIAVAGLRVPWLQVLRDGLLLLLAFISLRLSPLAQRRTRGFSTAPIVEVALLFAGIFVTVAPVIAMLKAGAQGPFASVVLGVTGADGEPVPLRYFWACGILSSFLDNAPTYLVFFNTAGGDAAALMSEHSVLMAISAGAVFMGANTYIGNAPNFMVRAMAEEAGVKMPSFFGYILRWTLPILIPLWLLAGWLFVA